jgi:hypothetical protein
MDRDRWRGMVGIFIFVIRDVGNLRQSNAASLGHLGQGAIREAVVCPTEFERVVSCVARSILGIAVHVRGSNDRFWGVDCSHAALNGLDIGIRRDYPALV